MTPAQQQAFETLKGSALTPEELAAIDPLLDPENRQDVGIAEILSVGRTRPNSREIGNGSILETIGLDAGNALLDQLTSNQAFRYVKPLLEQGRLKAGSPMVAAALTPMVQGGVITQDQMDALVALGQDPDPIHFNAVSDALNIAEGRPTL